MAIDGVQMDVADTAENEAAFGRLFKDQLPAPYPQVRVVGLGECGTHALVAAAIGGCLTGERELAGDLLSALEPDMLLIADRGFYSYRMWAAAAEAGACRPAVAGLGEGETAGPEDLLRRLLPQRAR